MWIPKETHNTKTGGTNYRTLWETNGPADEAVHDTHGQMDHRDKAAISSAKISCKLQPKHENWKQY